MSKESKELIEAKKLSEIAVFDKPPKLGGKARYLNPEELGREFKFQYDESMRGNLAEIKKYIQEHGDYIKELKAKKLVPSEKEVIDRLNHPLDCLALCQMPHSAEAKQDLGHGLFTLKKIPAGTILFLYSGCIEEFSVEACRYAHGLGNESLENESLQKLVNASSVGGLARFMQYLPTDREKSLACFRSKLLGKSFFELQMAYARSEDEGNLLSDTRQSIFAESSANYPLENTQFKSERIRAELATANVQIVKMLVKGIPTLVCYAAEDIEEGNMLGFDYGPNYFEADFEPSYFTREGNIIPTADYWPKSAAKLPEDEFLSFPLTDKNEEYILSLQAATEVKKNEPRDIKIENNKIHFATSWLEQLSVSKRSELEAGAHISFKGRFFGASNPAAVPLVRSSASSSSLVSSSKPSPAC